MMSDSNEHEGDSGDETSGVDEDCECKVCDKDIRGRHILVNDMHKHSADEWSDVRDCHICFCSYKCLLKWAKDNKKKYE